MSNKILLIVLLTFISQNLKSQGCSDAGLCTAGSMKDNGEDDEKWRFGLNSQYGQGDQKVNIFTQQLEIPSILIGQVTRKLLDLLTTA